MTFEERATKLDHKEIVALLVSQHELAARVEELTRQLAWFKRQLFGEKSERRFVGSDSRQLMLGEWRSEETPGQEITVAEHRRRIRIIRNEEQSGEEPVRFDESVPVEEIRLPHRYPARLGYPDADWVLAATYLEYAWTQLRWVPRLWRVALHLGLFEQP